MLGPGSVIGWLTDAFAACGYWPELMLGVDATDDTRASVCFFAMLRSPALPECSAAARNTIFANV
jgi:hypothetical protein